MSKRKKLLRALALSIVPPIAALAMRFIYYTSRCRFHLPLTIPSHGVIFAVWHEDLLLQPFVYSKFRQKTAIKVVISEHFDGSLIAKSISYFGFETIRGSTSRGAIRALVGAISALKSGYDVAVTPDGPRGPRRELSDGVVMMAQKSGAKVVVLGTKTSRYWQLSSWDKFKIAKPFGTIDFYASEPIDLSGVSLDDAKRVVKEQLDQICAL